jgi:hypothetical protein
LRRSRQAWLSTVRVRAGRGKPPHVAQQFVVGEYAHRVGGEAGEQVEDAVAVGGQVVGEEAARGGVLFGEQDRAGGL